MTDHGLIFTAWSVKRILAGRKTQTRRLVKGTKMSPLSGLNVLDSPLATNVTVRRHGVSFDWGAGRGSTLTQAHPMPGDRIWARETFYVDTYPEGKLPEEPTDEDRLATYYRADGECCQQIPECQCADVGPPRWRSPIFMPKWAARIWLRVTDVRVERVQDITTEDIIAEGLSTHLREHDAACHLRDQFAAGWNDMHGKRPGASWEANPWVWAISFEVES